MISMINDFFFFDTVQASCLALVTVVALTVIRDYLPKKNQWVWVALLIHGGLLAYFSHRCAPLDEITTCGPALHELACGNTGGFKISEWGAIERFITLVLCFGAVGVNVIPKYRKRDLAERHVARIKKSEKKGAMSNPLLFHIITGILTVLGSGLAAQFGRFSDGLIVALVLFDVGHQLSIYRLIPNHDGVWVLRCGNVNLAIVKCIALFRLAEDPQAKIDLVFMYSAGFMFTRVFNFACGFAHVKWLPKEAWMHEYWYSLGLSGAQFWTMFRTASFSMPCFWFSCIVTSVLYYHKLWTVENRRWLTLVNCVLFVFSFYVTDPTAQIGLCLVYYYFAGFRLPHYHRHRCPRKWRPINVTFSRSNSFASFITPSTSYSSLPDLDDDSDSADLKDTVQDVTPPVLDLSALHENSSGTLVADSDSEANYCAPLLIEEEPITAEAEAIKELRPKTPFPSDDLNLERPSLTSFRSSLEAPLMAALQTLSETPLTEKQVDWLAQLGATKSDEGLLAAGKSEETPRSIAAKEAAALVCSRAVKKGGGLMGITLHPNYDDFLEVTSGSNSCSDDGESATNKEATVTPTNTLNNEEVVTPSEEDLTSMDGSADEADDEFDADEAEPLQIFSPRPPAFLAIAKTMTPLFAF